MRFGIFLVLLILGGIGCIGGKTAELSPMATTPAATTPATSAPVTTTAPTQAPVQTTPPPYAYLFSPSTPLTDVVPAGADKVESLTDADLFVLKFPTRTAEYDSGVKVTYQLEKPAGTIYILKFKSVTGAKDFFTLTLEKMSINKETATEETLTVGGQSLKIYHRSKFTEFFATFIQKGVFIFYVDRGISQFETAAYIKDKMAYLFVPDIEVSTGTQTAVKVVDFSSIATQLADIVPSTSRIGTLSDLDYTDTLKLPPKTSDFDTGIKASYDAPPGAVYVLKFKSTSGASSFFQSILDKIGRSSEVAVQTTLTLGGKSLVVYHKSEDRNFRGTFILKGLFIYYVDIGSVQLESESYIKTNMAYMF